MHRILILLTIFITGCATTSKLNSPVAENNKDVLILSTLIHDHLRRTMGQEFNLNELLQNDSLKRIINNFERIELKERRTGISVYYKFSTSRDNTKIELTDKEKEMLRWKIWVEKEINKPYDGEIQFAFPEKLYHFVKIIVKK
jgi:hypothetical protein